MPDEFDVLMSAEPDRLSAPPRDLAEVATLAVGHMQVAIVKGTLPHLVLLTFHGAEMRTWILKGSPPAPVDDVIRGIAAHAECDALAFVFALPVPKEVTADRTVNVAIEGFGGSFDVLFAMRGRHGEADATFQLHQRPVGENLRWLGVPTTWSFLLYGKDAGFGGPTEGEA